MSLNRRELMVSAAAAGLAGCASTPPPAPLAAPPPAAAQPTPYDAALSRYLDDLAQRLLIRNPEQATSLGLDKGPREGLKSQLATASGEIIALDADFCAGELKVLEGVPDEALSPPMRLHKAVTAYALALGRDAGAFPYGINNLNAAMSESASPYVVTQQSGAYASVPEFLDSQHSVETAEDADAYLARLNAFATNLRYETLRIRRDAAMGVVPPDFILSNAIGQQEGLLRIRAAESRLVTSLAGRTQRIPGGYRERARDMVETQVYPALADQLAALKALQPAAAHDAGVWKLPDGEAYYRWHLKGSTSTSLTADEIHRMGLEQNRAIEARMDGLLRAQGLTQGTVGERMTALGNDPRYLFPDNDSGRAQLIAYINGRIAAVRPKLAQAFTLQLKAPVEVKRVPPEIQDGAGQGYMNFGSLDGSRPAIYYINLKSTKNWPRFSLPTLTFHEGVPGHALTGAYLTETGKLPLIRIILSGFNAHVEGYALYAEQLADEIGMYDDDWAGRLGYLQAQKFRAVRLVVDTGLHAKRWSREQAIQWAVENSGRTRQSMTSEIDRYCATPGQACGYKIGHTEINRMRDKARAALGPRFDVRRFNDLLLQTGSVPLTVLDAEVDRFVATGGRYSA
ncbi:DUF885 domain-containing protein [Phenylobacterium sp.]|jgi:uncharacterized protein (DUF885 family)|uniref:DUF885 domain-containing protein n=1 Tax=Phenylobacterium sp. TaxID=1871053 RepID=UPI002F94A0CE